MCACNLNVRVMDWFIVAISHVVLPNFWLLMVREYMIAVYCLVTYLCDLHWCCRMAKVSLSVQVLSTVEYSSSMPFEICVIELATHCTAIDPDATLNTWWVVTENYSGRTAAESDGDFEDTCKVK